MHTISSRFGALLSTAFSLRGALAGAGRALYWRFAGNQFAFLGGTFAQNFLQAAVVPAHNFISRCEAHAAVTARISRTNPIDSNQTAKESPRGQS